MWWKFYNGIHVARSILCCDPQATNIDRDFGKIFLSVSLCVYTIRGAPRIFQKNFLRRWERLRQQKVGLFESPRLRFY